MALRACACCRCAQGDTADGYHFRVNPRAVEVRLPLIPTSARELGFVCSVSAAGAFVVACMCAFRWWRSTCGSSRANRAPRKPASSSSDLLPVACCWVKAVHVHCVRKAHETAQSSERQTSSTQTPKTEHTGHAIETKERSTEMLAICVGQLGGVSKHRFDLGLTQVSRFTTTWPRCTW